MNKTPAPSPWDQRYGKADYYYGTEPNSFLVEQKSLFFKGAKVLCLAEGEGRNAVFLAKLGCDVTAVDSSQMGLNKLSKLAKENKVNIKTVLSDLNDFDFTENNWDFIISIWCHLPSALRAKIHKKSIQSLRKGGFIILEAYTPDQLKFKTGGPQDPDMMSTQTALKAELKGLNFVLLQEIERNISEGIGHQGMSAVVQVVAKKGGNVSAKINDKISQVLLFLGVIFSLSPWGSADFSLALGVLIAVQFGNPYVEITKKYSQKLLAYSIVGLGAGMNLIEVGKVGLSGLGYTVVSISLTLLLGFMLGKIFKSDRKTSILISVGTAICGGSAIAAVAPVLRAKSHSISVALGTVFILNAVALVTFPMIGHYFNLSQQQFGLWSALAIHDTSSVVGAGLQYGAEALKVGTTVKLARALWIVPVTLAFGFFQKSKDNATEGKAKKPWFILGFLLMAAIVTWIPESQNVGHWVELLAKKGLVLTLFLIGANLTRSTLKAVGIRPFLQGLTLWMVVLVSTLFVIKL